MPKKVVVPEGAHPLLAWRLRKGVSQTQVSKDIGVSQSYLSAIELRKRPVTDNMAKLLKELTGMSMKKIKEV